MGVGTKNSILTLHIVNIMKSTPIYFSSWEKITPLITTVFNSPWQRFSPWPSFSHTPLKPTRPYPWIVLQEPSFSKNPIKPVYPEPWLLRSDYPSHLIEFFIFHHPKWCIGIFEQESYEVGLPGMPPYPLLISYSPTFPVIHPHPHHVARNFYFSFAYSEVSSISLPYCKAPQQSSLHYHLSPYSWITCALF